MMSNLEATTPTFARGWAKLPTEIKMQVLFEFLESVLPLVDRYYHDIGYLVIEPYTDFRGVACTWPHVYDEDWPDRPANAKIVGQAKSHYNSFHVANRNDIEKKVLSFPEAHGQIEMMESIAIVRKRLRLDIKMIETNPSWPREKYSMDFEKNKIFVRWSNATEQAHWLERFENIVAIESRGISYNRCHQVEYCSIKERTFCICDFSLRNRIDPE